MQLWHSAFGTRLAAFTSALLITAWAFNAPAAPAQGTNAPGRAQPAGPAKKTPGQPPAPALAKQNLVDVNSADLKTLDTLPGVGPVLAQRIIDGRPYRSFADLERVKGLGKAKLEELKGKVVAGPVPAKVQPAGKKSQDGKSTPAVGARPQPASTPAVRNVGAAGSNAVLASLIAPARRASGKLAPGQQININKATVAELEALPGIGPTKAESIVAFRTLHGDFKAIEDIQKVKGIKAAGFEKLKDYIKVAD